MKRFCEQAVNYNKFVIVSHLRSGTHLLRTSLESHPSIVCQTEVFNSDSDQLPYPLSTTTAEVLNEWVYRDFPSEITSVGFILQAYHPWGLQAFPGIRENPHWADIWPTLKRIPHLKVIHLRRENVLRRHLSHVLARETGHWHAWDRKRVALVSHLETIPQTNDKQLVRSTVTLDAARLRHDFEEVEQLHDRVEDEFSMHEYHSVSYESLVKNFTEVCEEIQVFLGVAPTALSAAVFKLEDRPLVECIENYAELRQEFEGTRWAPHFND